MKINNFESLLLSVAMGIVSLLLLSHVFSTKSDQKDFIPKSAYSIETSQLVNKYLQQTASVVSLEQARIERDNERLAPQVGQTVKPGAPMARFTYTVDHSPDRDETNAIQDIRKKGSKNTYRPNQVVMRELTEEEQIRFYKALYKEKYIQQFVENARRGGYEVKLDENDVVVDVTKIKKPSPILDLSNPVGRQAQ
jgi:hypothetical protein